jgi:transposase InsO family protein
MGDRYSPSDEEVDMTWRETHVMDERMRFIVEWQADDVSFAELCRRYGISRKAGYKWTARYEAAGIEGLKDRSRAPLHHPTQVSEAVEAAILAVRSRHATWGAKKILAKLREGEPKKTWPCLSTVSALLDRHGLVRRRRWRRHVPPMTTALSASVAPNDTWGIDFKGWFRTGDGRRCDPLSLSDLATRLVLRLQVVAALDGETVWRLLEAAFREYGLPLALRSDNGPPFAGTGAGGLSWLAVQVIKAGVMPERIALGRPQQNGRHERMHLTLQQETASPPAASLRAQQRRFDAFRREFNEERPHEALGLVPPARLYVASPRLYSGVLREPEYAADHEVRRVRSNGEIKWGGGLLFISSALVGEPVGLQPIDDGRWLVRFGPVELGTLDAAGKFVARRAGARPRPARQALIED